MRNYYIFKRVGLICAAILGFYYGVLPLLGYKVSDLTKGYIEIDSSIATINILFALIAIYYLVAKNKLFTYKKMDKTENVLNESIEVGLDILIFYFGLYHGIYSLFGFKTFIRGKGLVQNSTYEVVSNILIAILILVYLYRKKQKK